MYELCQTTGQRAFSIDEILEAQSDPISDERKSIVHDRIYRIRQKIFEVSQRCRLCVDIQYLVRTLASMDGGDFAYEVNADIPTLDDENNDFWNEDVQALETKNRVLLVGRFDAYPVVAKVLLNKGYLLGTTEEVVADKAYLFDSNVVVIAKDFINDPIEVGRWIKLARPKNDIGILFLTNREDAIFVNEVIQTGIPMENIISADTPNWVSRFLQALENEKRRVFVGDAPEYLTNTAFPIVEILDGTDFDTGILELSINEVSFSMKPRKNGALSSVLARLLQVAGEELSWERLSQYICQEISRNNRKTWTQRLRKTIGNEWLLDPESEETRIVLETTPDGLRLNVRTLDLRTTF